MKPILKTCCGIDVHKKEVVACLLKQDEHGNYQSTICKFATTRNELFALKEWLLSENCRQVAMESTGVYWKPLYNILEDSMEITLTNAKHMKNVPGRKTDIKDCEWIAELLCCGLLSGSFIPPKPIRELRDLLRYYRKLEGERSREKNRVEKLLEDTGIKISGVLSDLYGVSGRAILKSLIAGKTPDQDLLATIIKGRAVHKLPELQEALEGDITDHHRFILKTALEHIEYLESIMETIWQQVEKKLKPYQDEYQRLQTIPGVKELNAACIIAEMGTDMNAFPTSAHLASWAGLSPGNNESAGKKKVQK